MTTQARHLKGTSRGGQFASMERDEPDGIESVEERLDPTDFHPSELIERDADGWLVPTERGLEVEADIRAIGRRVAERADQMTRQTMTERFNFPECEGFLGSSKAASTHEGYMEQVQARKKYLKKRSDRAFEDANRVSDWYHEKWKHIPTIRERNELDTGDRHVVDATWERYERWNKQYISYLHLEMECHEGNDPWQQEEARVRKFSFMQALAEERSMGPSPGWRIPVDSGLSEKRATEDLNKALVFYPTRWLEDESDRSSRLLVVKGRVKRAHYQKYKKLENGFHVDELTVSAKDPLRVATHEYAHRCEHLRPEVKAVMQVFLARRTMHDGKRGALQPYIVAKREMTKGAPATALDLREREKGTGKTEWTRDGGFANPYVGKHYAGSDTEVLSMGMESLFCGSNGGLEGRGAWRADLEHRDLVLGTLATL